MIGPRPRDPFAWLAHAQRRRAPLRARAVAADDAALTVALPRGVEGLIPREELPFLAGRPYASLVGETLPAMVTRVDPNERAVELSARLAPIARCRRAHVRGRAVRGRVVVAGEHGLLLDLGGARGFVPAEAVPAQARVTEGARWRGRPTDVTEHLVVLGGAPAAAAAPGGIVSGIVESLGPEGAWVRLDAGGTRRALATSDELGWTPRAPIAVGDEVAGAVLDLTMSGPRISLRALQPDPWPAIALELPPGTPVTGAVRETRDDGALVCLVDQPHVECVVPHDRLPGAVRPGGWLHARVERVEPAAARLALADVRTGPDPRRGRAARTA